MDGIYATNLKNKNQIGPLGAEGKLFIRSDRFTGNRAWPTNEDLRSDEIWTIPKGAMLAGIVYCGQGLGAIRMKFTEDDPNTGVSWAAANVTTVAVDIAPNAGIVTNFLASTGILRGLLTTDKSYKVRFNPKAAFASAPFNFGLGLVLVNI